MKEMKVIRVTVTEDYYIEMCDEEKTEINGWTIDRVIEDWFKDDRYPLSSHHATRDGHRIGNSRKFVDVEIMEEIPFKKI